MDEITEENPKKDEKKAFWVGLATLFCLAAIIVLSVFIIRGCVSKNQPAKEVDRAEKPQQSTAPAATPAKVEQGQVAGATVQPQTSGKSYTIESGDTLYVIGKKFKVDWRRIAEVNGIDNAAALKVGKTIIIPQE